MVEPALYGPVEVCLFLLLCSDSLIDSGREELLLFLLEKDLKFRKEFLGCTLFVAFSECICWIVWNSLLHPDLFRLYYLYIFCIVGVVDLKTCLFAYLFCEHVR